MAKFDPGQTLALVYIVGVAIQQVLQMIDPLVNNFVQLLNSPARGTATSMSTTTDIDRKKSLMAVLAFLLGLGAAGITEIRLLDLVWKNPGAIAKLGDFVVTGLVLGIGAEAANTVFKYLGYIKDAQKPITSISLTITTLPSQMKVGTTFQFYAEIKNSSSGVQWEVLHSNGGSIDIRGLYTAPSASGTFPVRCSSIEDKSKLAITTVAVVA